MSQGETQGNDAGGPRWFTCDGETWGASIAGVGAAGTGFLSIRAWEAVHFCREGAADVPVREALLARGRFDGLFDDELCALLKTATDIVMPGAPGPAPEPAD